MKMYLQAVLLLLAIFVVCGQALVVELSEADYRAGASENVTGQVITSPTQTQQPIQILLLPLTIDEYNEMFLVGPCNIPSDARPAQSTDFDQTPIVIEIPTNPHGNILEIEFQVSLLPSTAVEAEETFLLLLNVTNSDVELGDQACSIVRIEASDPPPDAIRLEQRAMEVPESSGFNHLFNIIKTRELEVSVLIVLSASGQAQSGVDFVLPTTTLRIEPQDSVAQVSVNITDDAIAEDEETFTVTVTVRLEGITFLQIERSVVTIRDDEVIVFGLVEEEIHIFEGNEGEFCAGYLNNTAIEFDRFSILGIQLTMADGTAISGEDYIAGIHRYRPERYPRISCYPVQTIDDDIQQPVKYFTVNFDTTLASDVTKISPSSTRINIINDDILTVELTEVDYSVHNDAVIFTGLVRTSTVRTQKPLEILLLPLTIAEYNNIMFPAHMAKPCDIPRNARPAQNSDFDQTPIVISIPAKPQSNHLEVEFQVPLLPSTAVEAEETFLLLLNTTNGNVQVGSQACSVVRIEASDPPPDIIRLERRTMEISESFGLNHLLNIIKTRELEVAIDMVLSVSGQALSGVDFTFPTTTLRIEPEELLDQVYINIIDDNIAEDDESFTLTVTARLEGIAASQIERAVVTIEDNEVLVFGFAKEEISILEGEEGQFCAGYLNTTAVLFDRFSIPEIQLTMADETALSDVDYIAAPHTYRLQSNPMISCFPVQTIDNGILQPVIYFTVNFDTSQASAVTKITPSSMRINIKDDDVLMVELSEADYSVDSNEAFFTGLVSTSLTPAQEPIEILLLPLTIPEYRSMFPQPSDGPCNIPDDARPAQSSDFSQAPIIIEIPSNPQPEVEFQVPLRSSNTVEAEETFLLLLDGASTFNVEVGDQACSIVKIRASDPPPDVIRLERRMVVVPESFGSNRLFNIVKTRVLEVAILIELGISGQAQSGMLPTTTLRIEPEELEAGVNIDITDDSIAEDDETFNITVTARIEGIMFSQTESVVVTVKDDEVLVFGFAEEEISIFEGDEGQFCVEYLNSTATVLERTIPDFYVTMADGTAIGDKDYVKATNVYMLERNSAITCFPIQTIANDLQQPARYFTVNFDTSLANDVTKITPSSTRINVIDDDGPPVAPQVEKAEPGTNETMALTWTAQSSRTNPTHYFTVSITVDGNVREPFNITNTSVRDHTLTNYQGEKEYSIVICAVNHIATSCSDPFKVLPTIVNIESLTTMAPSTTATAPPNVVTALPANVTEPPSIKTVQPSGLAPVEPVIPPGLIAIIVAVVVAAILVCLLLLLLFLLTFCCRRAREMAYYPGKHKGKELKGESRSESFEEEDEFYEDDVSYS